MGKKRKGIVDIVGGKRTKKGVNKAFNGVSNVFTNLNHFGIVKPIKKKK